MSAAQSGPAQSSQPRHPAGARARLSPKAAAAAESVAQRIGEQLGDRLPAVTLRLAPLPDRRAPRVPFVALVGSVLLAGVLGLLLFNTSMQQSSFTASSLESRAVALEARQQTLKMEIEQLRDPQRVAQKARNLGMVTAGAPVFLDLSDGSVLGDPVVAIAEDRLRIEPSRATVPAALQPERIVIVDKSLLQRAASRGQGAARDRTVEGADQVLRPAGEGSEGQDADE